MHPCHVMSCTSLPTDDSFTTWMMISHTRLERNGKEIGLMDDSIVRTQASMSLTKRNRKTGKHQNRDIISMPKVTVRPCVRAG